MGFVNDSAQGQKYLEIANRISDTLEFMKAIGYLHQEQLKDYEVLNFIQVMKHYLLPYEEAMTRMDSTTGEMYDTSAHMVWIGDRTRQPDGAHVEFCRGIKNPIGIKCGPSLRPR